MASCLRPPVWRPLCAVRRPPPPFPPLSRRLHAARLTPRPPSPPPRWAARLEPLRESVGEKSLWRTRCAHRARAAAARLNGLCHHRNLPFKLNDSPETSPFFVCALALGTPAPSTHAPSFPPAPRLLTPIPAPSPQMATGSP